MPIFGSDPDKESVEWDDMQTQQRYVSKPVRDLTNYFAYHRNMRMSQRCSEEDKSMLNILFSRRLKQGFQPSTIKEIIDRFYQSPASQTDIPAPLFCKNDVQNELMDSADVHKDDEVLQWLLDGMPSDGPFTDNREVRKAVLLHCEESLLRYPEVVADIVRMNDPEPYLSPRLSALERLILWNLEDSEEDAGHLHDDLVNITLPKELASSGRSPKSIRKRHETVKQAIIAIPMRRNKEKW